MKHCFSKYVDEMKAFGDAISSDLCKLIAILDYQCFLLDNARHHGHGYDDHLNEVKEILEKMAQKADFSNTQARNIFESLWNSLPQEIPYQVDRSIAFPTLEMTYDDKIPLFSAKLPPLLPCKMAKGANYLHDQVAYNILAFHDQWYEEHGRPIRITPATVAFVHCAKRGNWRNIRDYDNLERKRVLDALQIGGMFSDNPSRVVEINMMAWDCQSCTYVYITLLKNIHDLLNNMDFTAYKTNAIIGESVYQQSQDSVI